MVRQELVVLPATCARPSMPGQERAARDRWPTDAAAMPSSTSLPPVRPSDGLGAPQNQQRPAKKPGKAWAYSQATRRPVSGHAASASSLLPWLDYPCPSPTVCGVREPRPRLGGEEEEEVGRQEERGGGTVRSARRNEEGGRVRTEDSSPRGR